MNGWKRSFGRSNGVKVFYRLINVITIVGLLLSLGGGILPVLSV